MTLAEFHNGLRVIRSLDHHEVEFLNKRQWTEFSSDPSTFLIRCDDATADRIWGAMAKRMKL